MRVDLEYLSNTKGDCADDIDLNLISTEEEKEFICWTKALEDTVSHLQQDVLYFKSFIFKFSLKSKIFKEYGCFFNNFLTDVCVSMTMDIGKLCAEKNDLCINKYFRFCKNNSAIIFKENVDLFLDKLRKDTISQLKNKYEELIRIPRNQIYGHSGKIWLTPTEAENETKKVWIRDLQWFVTISKKFLTEIWKKYNGHLLCFEYKNSNDYEKIIEILEKE